MLCMVPIELIELPKQAAYFLTFAIFVMYECVCVCVYANADFSIFGS